VPRRKIKVPARAATASLGAILRFQIESDASGGAPFMNGATGLYTRTFTEILSRPSCPYV